MNDFATHFTFKMNMIGIFRTDVGVASGKLAEKPTTWVSEIENQAEDPEPEARAISKVD